MQNLIGQSLGRYHIIEKLGEGGMAVVYKAYDTRLERNVALKVIRKDAFPPNIMERMLKRFEREAKSMAKLSHTNIVKVMDYGEHDGNPYFVMELVPGGTLKERLGNPIPWQQALTLIEPVARALAYAHGEGILHRDVKPANILITKTGEPVLTDFGIAKLLETEENSSLTATGVGVGTPEYMAPEQGMGKQVDGRADVYALGIVLYELITGHKPYSADTPLATLLKQVHDPLPEPRTFVADLPDAIEKLLYKALAKNPDDRYQSMDDFVSALKKIQDQPAIKKFQLPTKPSRVQSVVAQPDGFATTDQLEVDGGERSGRRKRKKEAPSGGNSKQTAKTAVIILGGLAVVVLAIGAARGWFSPRNPAATQAPVSTENPATETAAPEETYAIGSTATSTKDGMTLVYVPAGEFIMGSPEGEGEDNEHPQHNVTLEAFWIDQNEVTNAMYEKCVSEGACTAPSDIGSSTRDSYYGNPQYADYPVIYVNWYKAKTYCEWAGRQLPSEEQWEKAARGTEGQVFPWGDEAANNNLTNFNFTLLDTTKVGSYPTGASPYGANDMAGNVWEWVADNYDYYPSDAADAPQGAISGLAKVERGGSWNNDASYLRTTYRSADGPEYTAPEVGFRCAATTEMVTTNPDVFKIVEPTTTQSGIGSTMTSEVDGMTQMYVPAGEFFMGSVDGVGEDDEHPQHSVTLDAYWIDQTEVTNAMYGDCVSAGACTEPRMIAAYARETYYQNPDYADYPVINVTWDQANIYCEWTGRRLPTEAEWEKAARGTEGNLYPWGDDSPDFNLANYASNIGDLTKVGSYPAGASPYGVLDMAGNAQEWVADLYAASYYAESPTNNPIGADAGSNRVLKGSSWSTDADSLRAADRDSANPGRTTSSLGFRCAINAN